MTNDAIKDSFKRVKVWKHGTEQAPHKPLLLLYAPGRCSRGEEREVSFREVDEKLSVLFTELGLSQKIHHLEVPFWRLQNDGLWTVSGEEQVQSWPREKNPKRGKLLRVNARGGFLEPIYSALSQDRTLRSAIVQQLLADYFPVTLHDRIIKAVGLEI